MDEGIRLLESVQHEGALREFLWCWDHSLEASPYFCGVRVSFLLLFMKRLAEAHPRCREEMQARKAALQQRLTTDHDDRIRDDIAALEKHGF
jgi:hypothetical protein